jgi:hypothetical protein
MNQIGKWIVKCRDRCDSCEMWAIPFRPVLSRGYVLRTGYAALTITIARRRK